MTDASDTTAADTSLDDVVVRAAALDKAPLAARLQWLEDAARAIERSTMGDARADAALQLRAALGAIVKFAQLPPEQRDDKTLLELELVVRTLLARGLLVVVQAQRDAYAALADARAPRWREAKRAADAYELIGKALAKGEPVPAAAAQALREIGEAIVST